MGCGDDDNNGYEDVNRMSRTYDVLCLISYTYYYYFFFSVKNSRPNVWNILT